MNSPLKPIIKLETQALVLEENDCKNSCRDLEKGSSDIVALVILIYSWFIIVMKQINTIVISGFTGAV